MLAKESIRSCLSCRKRALKADLIRVIWNGQKLCFDIPYSLRAKQLGNKKNSERLANCPGEIYRGRGVYLHASLKCTRLKTGQLSIKQRGKNTLLESSSWERGLKLERGTINVDVMSSFLEELKILQEQILLVENQIGNDLEDWTYQKKASVVEEVLNAESKASRSLNKQVPSTLLASRTRAKVRL